MNGHGWRIARLEYQRLYAMAQQAGRPHGLSADFILGEMKRFLALDADAQERFMPSFYADLTPDERTELKAIHAKHQRILRHRPE
jgi:hypothetical protein